LSFTGSPLHSQHAEQRAQRPVALQFFLLAPYTTVEAIRDLAGGEHPDSSWVGIGLAISSIVLMPALGIAKQRIDQRMGSVATQGEGAQNLRCAYMAAAMAIAALAVREGTEAWRGESCCIPAAVNPGEACHNDCCAPTPRATDTAAVATARPRRPTGSSPAPPQPHRFAALVKHLQPRYRITRQPNRTITR
jgi:hypothetical protein